ncbi:MAG: protein-export chaperone SecB [Salinivirgaceae bacterium]|jgi:preprotein translocase subunit SecB
MEQNNQLESGFRINNLLLLESNFKRISNVTFNNPDKKQVINVDVEVNINENNIFVTELVTLKDMLAEVEEVSYSVKMVGVFEKFGDSKLDMEEFGRVNGAAIIFPYIREHITNLSAKAGLGLLILPPFNFTKQKN